MNLIEKYYRENYDKLVKQAMKRVPNNSRALAEEAVQEAFYRATKYIKTYDDKKAEFSTWVSSILRNVINQMKMDEQPATFKDIDELQNELSVDDLGDKQYLPIITSLIDQESIYIRTILTMFYIHGYRDSEIAEFLGRKKTTIKQIIYVWRRKNGLESS